MKQLMKLKNRKGFTLVELIVVIAIVGVLAAILIPTMMGMVTKARVTSINNTAQSIRKMADTFLTQAEAAGYGMRPNSTQVFKLRAYRDSKVLKWECTGADTNNFYGKSQISWGSTGTYVVGTPPLELTQGEQMICAGVADIFPKVDMASVIVVLHNGKCTYAVCTRETDQFLADDSKLYPPYLEKGEPPLSFEWDLKTAGVNIDGIMIGTAPVVPLGDGT